VGYYLPPYGLGGSVIWMRILLAQNSLYYPAHGGGDKSNRLLVEALAARGHVCRVMARLSVFGEAEHTEYLVSLAARGVTPQSVADGVVVFQRAGVEVHVVTNVAAGGNLRARFGEQVAAFAPDIILVSTDDPAQLLLEVALVNATARVVYLARATLALPFGPDCAFPSQARTDRIRACDTVVGVSQYVADYIRKYAGIDAVHVPISLVEPGQGPGDWPALGRFDNEFVTFVNPCAVKGIAIFLALADAFPKTAFAAVPIWGTNRQDRAALGARPNVRLLAPVDEIDLLLARTRVLLVPSLWAEARSRIVLEALLRGVPVMAADVGGIPEAMMGVPYLLPVRPIEKYEMRLDEQMVPVAQVPAQDIGPWREALARLLTDRAHYEEIARQSRRAAVEYAKQLDAGQFEKLLMGTKKNVVRVPAPAARPSLESLSPEKRKLLALRLRQHSVPAAWFPNAATSAAPRLFYFPHAGGGAGQPLALSGWTAVPVRLPGRESRLAEAPFERMAPLVTALAGQMDGYLDQPFAFFGHSMGAVVAFELVRELRRRSRPLPRVLIASSARAPQFRRHHVPPPAPSREAFAEELRRLEGIPAEVLGDAALMRAILPALEADAALYRNYIYAEEPPLPIAVRAYGGADDPNVRREHLDGWREQTTASFAVRVFPGRHFYPTTAREAFLEALERDLAC
jgi:surfactin synthase thioesterase subunit/glycosyltransferase involved in cell wall biosynthesis